MIFRKTWTLTCKLHIKGTIFMKTWNDPTVITVILPQPVWLETPIKVKCLTKVLKVIFSKVWDSVWGLYSIIWYSSCGNFDADSIRTRLAWSWGSRIPKNHEFRSAWSRVSRNSKNHKFIIKFLEFWRSAAEAAACKLLGALWPCPNRHGGGYGAPREHFEIPPPYRPW
jgi:hypothetical protein